MEVLWFDCYGAVLFGDRGEIACIPHKGCRREILSTGPTPHRELNLLLCGQIRRDKRSFFFGDRFELPSGTKVGLRDLLCFKLQLVPRMTLRPIEDALLARGLEATGTRYRGLNAQVAHDSARAPGRVASSTIVGVSHV